MKTFLAIALFVILSVIGVKGQSLDIKAWDNRFNKALNLENIYDISTKGGNFKMQYPNLFKSPIKNQLKSASEANQKLDSMVYEVLDTISNQLVISTKAAYTYDAYGYESSEILYYLNDTTSQWDTGWKIETTYDANGNLILESTNSWDETTNQWLYIEKQEYTYDDYGNVILDMIYYGTYDNIRSGHKYENTYDGNGNVTLDSTFRWEVSTNQWNIYHKGEYTYDTSGNMTSIIHYLVDDFPSQWILFYKDEYTYDSTRNITSWTGSYWYNDHWYNDMKSVYFYDANGNMTLDSTFWDEYNSERYAFKREHTYDVNRNRTSTTYYYWNELTIQWVGYQRYTYYYSEFIPTSVPGIPENEIRVYPNPAKEYIVFDITNISSSASVELFNLQGKMVMEQKLAEDKQLIISNLHQGIYLYRLHDNGKIFRGKITVE